MVVLFGAAAAGGRLVLLRGAGGIRPGRATIALVTVVAIPSVIGLAIPSVREALQRDADRIVDGQVWRPLTSLVQQDGGVAGTVFNLFSLVVVGSVAERLLGPRRTVVTLFAVGLLAQLPALALQPVGAGNSVATFGLAGSVATVVLLVRPPRPIAAAALVALLGGQSSWWPAMCTVLPSRLALGRDSFPRDPQRDRAVQMDAKGSWWCPKVR